MAFFDDKRPKSKASAQKGPDDMIKPWQRYLDKKSQKTQAVRPVGAVLPKLKATRHRHLKRNLIIVLVPLLVLLLILLYYISPVSKVGAVFVTGTKLIPDQTVIDSSGIQADDHVLKLKFESGTIEKRILKANPGIEKANVEVHRLNQVTFSIDEYPRMGYLNRKNHYYSVLNNGIILKEKVNKPVGNLPVLENFTQGRKLNLLIRSYKALPVGVRNDISEIHLTRSKTNPYQVRLYMNDKNEVIADLRTLKKLNKYPTYAKTLKTQGVVDLEVGAFAYPFSKTTKK